MYVSRYGYQFHSYILYNYMASLAPSMKVDNISYLLYKHLLIEATIWWRELKIGIGISSRLCEVESMNKVTMIVLNVHYCYSNYSFAI